MVCVYVRVLHSHIKDVELTCSQDNNGFICHLDGQRHVKQDGEDILLTCDAPPPSGTYTLGSTGYTARLIERDERGLPVTAIHEWSMLVSRGEWVVSFASEQPGEWDDEKVYMTGKMWECEQGEYANIDNHNAEIWGEVAGK